MFLTPLLSFFRIFQYLQLLLALTLTLPLLTHTYPAAEEKSLPLDDVGIVDNDEAASAKDSQLQKRSGSTDYALHLKSGLLSGLGHASASIASSSSGGSSSGGYAYKPHGDGHHVRLFFFGFICKCETYERTNG